jgi:hypothetical protein
MALVTKLLKKIEIFEWIVVCHRLGRHYELEHSSSYTHQS